MPNSIKCGLSVKDFYDMTIKEIMIYIEKYKENIQEQTDLLKSQIYSTAQLTATFVGYVLNGKPIPSYDAVYGNKEINVNFYKERLLDYAKHVRKG